MPECIKPHSRVRQITGLLYDYGPLNRRTLMALTNPPMSTRRAQRSLQRMEKRGLILRCNKTEETYAKNFVQLAANENAKMAIGNILSRTPSDLNIPSFRAHDAEHSIICAYWSEYFRRRYPEAIIVRDFHLSAFPEILRRLVVGRDLEMYPDTVIALRNSADDTCLTIAIEIERTHKTRRRIFRKLNKFSTRSHIDGTIYLCPTSALNDLVASVYVKRLRKIALRIKQYGDFFLMFSNTFTPAFDADLQMFSSSGENITLSSWIHTLQSTLWQKRRDEFFRTGAPPCPSLTRDSEKLSV